MCSVPETKQNKQASRSSTFTPTHPLLSLSSSMEEELKPDLAEEEEDKHEDESQVPSRTNSLIGSPEFEFCMVRNPSSPQPQLLFADELIADGVLVPLDLVSQPPESDPKEKETSTRESAEPKGKSLPESLTSSKRWTDIFKISSTVTDKKACTPIAEGGEDKVKKKKKKDRKSVGSGSNGNGTGSAELNINIWPFSRSWSGGNNRSKSGGGGGSRKVSSAPCSRSNSAGESKSRNRLNSPRPGGGIYLGRNSPVWQQVRRKDGAATAAECRKNKNKNNSPSTGGGGDVGGTIGKGRGLNLSVPMCMGYRQQLSCRREDNILVDSGGGAAEGNKFFHLRTLFTKKVH